MTLQVVIIDYGVGNLLSVARAFEHLGARVQLSAVPKVIASADRVVFPGVGAFGSAMQTLFRQKLVEPIVQYCGKERPFLGICLGMQMMLDSSEEFGRHSGLGLIAGEVRAIPLVNPQGHKAKVPHIGWSPLLPAHSSATQSDWDIPLLKDVKAHSFMYFVHSFHAITGNSQQLLAVTRYNEMPLAAVIGRGNLYGCQFHPEKSGEQGLKILRNFLAL